MASALAYRLNIIQGSVRQRRCRIGKDDPYVLGAQVFPAQRGRIRTPRIVLGAGRFSSEEKESQQEQNRCETAHGSRPGHPPAFLHL